MNKDPQQTGNQDQDQQVSHTKDNPKNPFKEDAPVSEASAEEEAELEQQRKEALTERD
jgi:hypothetical protein